MIIPIECVGDVKDVKLFISMIFKMLVGLLSESNSEGTLAAVALQPFWSLLTWKVFVCSS